jgi:hypothetical protein
MEPARRQGWTVKARLLTKRERDALRQRIRRAIDRAIDPLIDPYQGTPVAPFCVFGAASSALADRLSFELASLLLFDRIDGAAADETVLDTFLGALREMVLEDVKSLLKEATTDADPPPAPGRGRVH